jgi:hypothetical protein
MPRTRRGSKGIPSIRTTYDIVTEESAAHGDVAERGWIDEEGEVMEPDADEEAEGITAVSLAVKFLRDAGGIYPSSSGFHPGVWYSNEAEQDYRTGEWETRSYHLVNFTTEEQKEIYEALTHKPWRKEYRSIRESTRY